MSFPLFLNLYRTVQSYIPTFTFAIVVEPVLVILFQPITGLNLTYCLHIWWQLLPNKVEEDESTKTSQSPSLSPYLLCYRSHRKHGPQMTLSSTMHDVLRIPLLVEHSPTRVKKRDAALVISRRALSRHLA